MTWDLIVSRSAKKRLRRSSARKRIDAAFEQMTRDPYSGDTAVLNPDFPDRSQLHTAWMPSVMAYPVGDAKLEPLRVDFDCRVEMEFHGSDISSDGDDPVMHAIVDRKGLDRMAVASSQMRRFETEFWLSGRRLRND